MRTSDGQPVRLADYRVPDFLVDSVDLQIDLDRRATRVISTLSLRPNPSGQEGAALALDGDELVFLGAELDGAELSEGAFEVSPKQFVLANPPRRPFTLRIETRLDPTANTKLMGLYRSGSAYCTQCEAEGFRRITFFPDRPDVLSTYRVRIEADRTEAPVLLSNGNLETTGDADRPGRHFSVWRDPHKKPSYLFALVAGELAHVGDVFVTASKRRVALGVYVEPGREARAQYAVDALKRAMAWDERAYGREYDLDVFNIVAVSDFNMGAMENKGLNVFNDKYILASPETATDDDYAGIESVIAHEYFHNWTGNRVTCRDWFQLCLKEGLTVFRDQQFSADERSAPVKRIADVRGLRAAQFPEDAGPLAHNVRPEVYHEINNFYTATVYQKGAEVIRMLRTLIGPQAFRAGMDLYFERRDGAAATVEDFIACFAATSGRDLSQFMRWYSQAGTPRLTVRSAYDAAERTYQIDIAQSLAPTPGQELKQPMTIPIAIGLVGREGGDVILKSDDARPDELASGVFELDTPSRTIVFRDVASKPALSFVRGFSAPVRVDDDISDSELIVLSRHDSDRFNRWQSLQSLATRILIRSVAAIRAGGALARNDAFIAAYGAVLEDAKADRIDPAFAALAMTLPSEADIARDIGENVDPNAIFAARERLRGHLGRAHRAILAELHDRLADSSPFSPTAAHAGRRALRNGALAMLAAGERRGRPRARRGPIGQGEQHDRNVRRDVGARPHSGLRTGEGDRGLRPTIRRRAADPRQVVRAASADSRRRHARSRARTAAPSCVFPGESQSRAFADRRLRGQPDAVQPRRRRGLPAPGGDRRQTGRFQSPSGGAPSDSHAIVALDGGSTPGSGGVRAAAHRRAAVAVAGPARHRHPQPGLTRDCELAASRRQKKF